jgi:hypothetical protein
MESTPVKAMPSHQQANILLMRTPEPMKECTSPPPTAWKKHTYEQMVITEKHLQQIVGRQSYAVQGSGQNYQGQVNEDREKHYRRGKPQKAPQQRCSCDYSAGSFNDTFRRPQIGLSPVREAA